MDRNKKVIFGIVSPYPDAQVPEKEIINRIKSLVDNNDYGVMHIFNRDGYLLQDKTKHIEDMNLDFIIDSDHSFCSLQVDCFSYMCIWMPSGFSSFGLYPNYIFNLNSIDDFLDTFKVKNENEYMNNILKKTGHYLDDGMHFFPTPGLRKLSLKPKKLNEYKLFYSGLNVERILHENGKTLVRKGRHHELFTELDKRDYMRFHGPKMLASIAPWEGFSKYYGEIPFDGESIFKKINQYGVSLVLHYKAHEYRGLPTTRIFESCLSGAIIISDDIPFIRNIFGDSVFLIDTSKPVKEIVKCIDDIMDWIILNPQKAQEKAFRSQKIFLEKLANTDVVEDLCKNHMGRKKEILNKLHLPVQYDIIDIIITCKTASQIEINHILEQIAKQSYPNLNLIFICSETLAESLEKCIDNKLKKIKYTCKIIVTGLSKWPVATKTTGELIIESKPYLKGKYFILLEGNQNIHELHLSTLANRIAQKDSLLVSYSGTYYKYSDTRVTKNNRPIAMSEITSFYKYFDTLEQSRYKKLFDMFENKFLKCSVLFKRKVIDECDHNELKFIEGCEHIYFLIKAISKNGIGSYSFTHRVSCGLNLNNIKAKYTDDMEKQLYPYRLTFKEHQRVFQTTPAQLLDCFVSDIDFEQYAINYSDIYMENIIVKSENIKQKTNQRLEFRSNMIIFISDFLMTRPFLRWLVNTIFRKKF